MKKLYMLSGWLFSFQEILEQVIIKNLDTGEAIPLSLAAERLPQCTNPLALHILRLAVEEGFVFNYYYCGIFALFV